MKKLKYILLLIFVFILTAFNFSDKMIGSWNPQYIYNTNGQSIIDMAFADSINGYVTLRGLSNEHPGTIIKTTNAGNNWYTSISYPSNTVILNNIEILNNDTILVSEGFSLIKTTNGGQNWIQNSFPGGEFYSDWISAFNLDTIWAAGGNGIHPVLYLTTNGGLSWNLKFLWSGSGVEFSRVYFYNKQIGFCYTGNNIFKTTNGGENWFIVSNETSTKKIQFTDSLTGWKCDNLNFAMKKTTDGGYNWITQTLPSGGQIYQVRMYDFSILNKDTIWGVGGSYYRPPPWTIPKGIIYLTTNGGVNWGFQIPDTNLSKYSFYDHISFFNKKYGWAYESDSGSGIRAGGVHTITGGLDSTVYVGINESNLNITKGFILFQNYPNPFNPTTSIKYKVESIKQIKLVVYDILGKEITTLVNQKQKPGSYEVRFDGGGLPSGVYYYALYADGVRIDAKKMVLLK